MVDSMRTLAKDGISACPEGAATLAGLRELVKDGRIDSTDTVVLYNTGTALKYLDILEKKRLPVLAQDAETIPDM